MILSEMKVLQNQNKAREEPVSWILRKFKIDWMKSNCWPGVFFGTFDTFGRRSGIDANETLWDKTQNPTYFVNSWLRVLFRLDSYIGYKNTFLRCPGFLHFAHMIPVWVIVWLEISQEIRWRDIFNYTNAS